MTYSDYRTMFGSGVTTISPFGWLFIRMERDMPPFGWLFTRMEGDMPRFRDCFRVDREDGRAAFFDIDPGLMAQDAGPTLEMRVWHLVAECCEWMDRRIAECDSEAGWADPIAWLRRGVI